MRLAKARIEMPGWAFMRVSVKMNVTAVRLDVNKLLRTQSLRRLAQPHDILMSAL